MIDVMTTDIVTKKLFTVEEFGLICDAGVFPPESRYELIRGEIMEKPAPGPPHVSRVNRLNRLMTTRFGDSVIVSIQNPAVLSAYSFTLPDVALLKDRKDFYGEKQPAPEDVLLLIEVADTSARFDATIKAELYAETGIREYWLLDINKDVLIVHTNPAGAEYQSRVVHHRGETISPQQFSAVTFTIDEILG